MYKLKLDPEIIIDTKFINASVLKPHEEIVQDRAYTFLKYLKSIDSYIILPSIIIDENCVIIDGHHRFWALEQLGVKNVPVTIINYNSELIIPHNSSNISKQNILNAALTGDLLKPKSSFHHFLNLDNSQYYPLILLSSLFKV